MNPASSWQIAKPGTSLFFGASGRRSHVVVESRSGAPKERAAREAAACSRPRSNGGWRGRSGHRDLYPGRKCHGKGPVAPKQRGAIGSKGASRGARTSRRARFLDRPIPVVPARLGCMPVSWPDSDPREGAQHQEQESHKLIPSSQALVKAAVSARAETANPFQQCHRNGVLLWLTDA